MSSSVPMGYLKLAEARSILWKQGVGEDDTFVPYASKTAADSLAVDTMINHVIQRFIIYGNFRGATVRARFKVFDDQITLPSTLSSVIGATPIRDVDSTEDGVGVPPYAIYSEQHEFAVSGPGNPSSERLFGLVDLGDNFSTFLDPSGEFYLKVYSSTAETATILLKGLDTDSAQIYTAGVEGVSLTLTTTPGNTTSQVFTFLSSWQKSATTTGVVRIYAVDTTTAEETLLVIIPPNKTTSGYHRYRVPDSTWGDTVEALCRRAYIPAVADNDLIISSNIAALKMGMMALRFEDKNDFVNAAKYWGPNKPNENPGAFRGCFDHLDDELNQFRGEAVLPTVQFRAGYGAGNILNLI